MCNVEVEHSEMGPVRAILSCVLDLDLEGEPLSVFIGFGCLHYYLSEWR